MKRAKAGEFNPVYCLQSDVDISSIALTGMKQSGLCVMKNSGFEFHPDDTYSMVDEKLRIIFPKLFDWLCESEPYDAPTVTRYPVPAEILEQWRPCISAVPVSASKGSDFDNQSSDEIDNDTSSPTFSPIPLPSTQPSSRYRLRRNRSEDEVEQDIISISSMSGKKFNFCI